MSLARQFERIFTPKFERRVKEVERIMKAEAPKGETGALRDAIRIQRVSFGRCIVGVDSAVLATDPRNASNRDYSQWVVNGHGAYVIRPVRARALRWVGKDGQVHYARYVRIPAAKGNDFVSRAKARVPKFK